MTKPAASLLPSVAHLGTFPPTQCGLATFGAALTGSMREVQPARPVRVVDVVDVERPLPTGAAVQLVNGQPTSLRRVAEFIAEHDALLIEHEFGIFGGDDGDEVLDLLDGVQAAGECATVTVLHTVLDAPTVHQRRVVERVAAGSGRLVVMSRAAEERLLRRYEVEPQKVCVVPHGARLNPPVGQRPAGRRPTVLTWGLLGPGKGLEAAIEAMVVVSSLIPPPRYVIAGQTHPKVQAQSGERYREGLQTQVRERGLQHVVEFDATYRDLDSLAALIRSADVVLLPYETREQVTSGVLVEAIASERPVVSTDFPHARELLVPGAGLVVPHGDPEALGRAVAEVLTRPRLAESMRAEARRIAASLAWHAVAAQYCRIIDEAVGEQAHEAAPNRSSSVRVA